MSVSKLGEKPAAKPAMPYKVKRTREERRAIKAEQEAKAESARNWLRARGWYPTELGCKAVRNDRRNLARHISEILEKMKAPDVFALYVVALQFHDGRE